jgi:hypothetical protein
MQKKIFFSLLIVLLPSCVTRHIRKTEGVSFAWALMQARYVDVPLPLQSVPDLDKSVSAHDQAQVTFVFTIADSRQSMCDYYLIEMEQLGWQREAFLSSSPDHRAIINFRKPHKFCTVVIDPGSTCTEVSVHVIENSVAFDDATD